MPFLIALRALGGSLLGFLGRLNPYQLALIALALFALVQHFEIVAAHRHSRKVETQLTQCTAARHADQLAYTAAQVEAQAKNHADVARIETQQQKVTTDVETDYRSKLDALRRELRAPAPAPQGSAGKPGVPQVPNAAGGPGSQEVPLPSDELLRAAETELQLNALIDWVNKQTTAAH